MAKLQTLCNGIDAFTALTGKIIIWLSLLLILTTCSVVMLRYVLGDGSIALQESITYMHATLFMVAMAFTLKQGGHVRVDVFYRNFSPRTQALVDVLGTLFFLMPLCGLILFMSWDYVASSWAIKETSTEGGGLKGVYLLKTLLLILPVTLILQGVSELLKNLLFFLGKGGSHTPEKLEQI